MYLKDNELDVKTYLELRTAVNWRSLTKEQAAAAIKGSLLTVVATMETSLLEWGES